MKPMARLLGLTAITAMGMAVIAPMAFAQAGDYATLGGSAGRTGKNENPNATGPGLGKLNWFAPFGAINTATIVLDNTAVQDTNAYPGGPYDATLYGRAASVPAFVPSKAIYNFATEWAAPVAADEASFPYLQSRRRITGTLPADDSRREPAYAFTRCTPSDASGDPTVALTTSDRRYFQWTFAGPTGGTRYYALHTWLPVGPTKVGGTRVFPQRYFVYEITYGSNQRFIDVVDSYASGDGWVRLGNGGKDTDLTFPYDGQNPIRVRLYNTVPRDAAGQLTMPSPVTNYCVYADAVRATPTAGRVDATPTTTGFGGSDVRTVAAVNLATSIVREGKTVSTVRGVVTSYLYNFADPVLANNTKWTYTPFDDKNGEGDYDNSSATVTFGLGWNVLSGQKFINGDFRENTVVTAGASSNATYTPPLVDGDYEVYAYLPGNLGTRQYGQSIVYQIIEGSTINTVTVDQSVNRGWVRLGSRRYSHVGGTAPLTVVVTNFSTLAGDAGKKVYADAIRFANAGNLAISSTPVQANARVRAPNGDLVTRKVVVVADESGHLHCLDAVGRGDGTTNEYWSYPSRKRSDTYVDPNFVDGIDAKSSPAPTPDTVPIAEMPTGFNLSSALVQRINDLDYLFIASTNGRIYCIEMAGRGDYNLNGRIAGTTRRIWTYPNDFPNVAVSSDLGAFTGSLAYARTSVGPTIIAPASNGRIYALDALPSDTSLQTKRSTVTRWTYPLQTEPTLGAIRMTPLIEFGRVFFGTAQKADQPGRFYALDTSTGRQRWVFPTDAQIANPAVDADIRNMGDFLSGPTSASTDLLGNTMPNTIFVLNQNQYVYALPAGGNGTVVPIWKTRELGVGSTASLGYTAMTVYDNSGTGSTRSGVPVVMVPTSDGRFSGLFARVGELNRIGTRRCYEYVAAGESIKSSMSFARGYMYGGDSRGFVYGFSNTEGNFGNPEWGQVPGQDSIVENNPSGDKFRQAKVSLITRDGYQRLRQPQGSPDHLTFAQATGPAFSFNRNPFAFEWGETIYIMVHNFPAVSQDTNGRLIPSPIVNISFNVEGQTVRSIPVETQRFENPGTAPLNAVDPSVRNDGYAVLAFTFQGGGPNALPPGNAEIVTSISTQSLNSRQAMQNVVLDPALAHKPFVLANPLGIAMEIDNSTIPQGIANLGIGLSTYPDNPQNIVNGSSNVTSGVTSRPPADRISDGIIAATDESRLLKTTGYVDHGQPKTARVYVYDRSMMGLIRPDDRGIDNIRISLDDLGWQGGTSTIFKSLNQLLYPGFEDLPGNYPNTSLDYPDIKRSRLTISKDPNGSAENPVYNGVTLRPPVKANGDPLDEDTLPENRLLRPTVFDVTVNVPQFQPPNNAFATQGHPAVPVGSGAISPVDPRYRQLNSAGQELAQGYLGRLAVFVDTTQNGLLDAGSREAFRSFNVATSVLPDQRISIQTPTIDVSTNSSTLPLGSLAAGTGYTNDGSSNPFGPDSGGYAGLFQSFTVRNEGNMNLLDVRLAKAEKNIVPSSIFGAIVPQQFYSGENDDQTWLDGTLDLWANFDTVFAPRYSGINRQIVQKARVGDTVPTELQVNPARRENANLGVTGSTLLGGSSAPPKVAVSVPIGFPAGRYTQRLRVIENETASNDVWDRISNNTVESFSDPEFSVSFTVRESRLTNTFTAGTAPMMDDLVPALAPKYTWSNTQPTAMRDVNGSLVVAMASNRPTDNTSTSVITGPALNSTTRLYVSSLDNAATFTPTRLTPPTSPSSFIRSLSPTEKGYGPLRDLDFFTPATTGTWFKKAAGSASGYPGPSTDFGALFGVGISESIIQSSISFGNPAFPTNGVVNPFRDPSSLRTAATNVFGSTIMMFTGTAQKQTASGTQNLSRLFATTVQTNDSGVVSGLGTPIPMPYDELSQKGKPTVIQTPQGAIGIYPATIGGVTNMFYTRFNGSTWTPPSLLPVGAGYDFVASPSAAGRLYRGATSTPIVELTFAGKLHGRPNADVYMGRIALEPGTLRPTEDANGNLTGDVFVDQPERTMERLTAAGDGQFYARGVQWNRANQIQLFQLLNGTLTDLLVPSSRIFDRESGLITYETRLGGSVTIDPQLGSIRFSGATPSRSAELRVTYTPKFIRISEGGAVAPSGTTGVFDDRSMSDISYWRTASGGAPTTQTSFRNDRFLFSYVRAAGAGSGARPYMTTMRLGVRLPYPILTDQSGSVVSLSVSGNVGPFQVDPANARVYFTAVDEGRGVTVTYTPVDAATGNAMSNMGVPGSVSLIQERSESPIAIEQATNESNLTTFIDPFDFVSSDFRVRRPPLMWLFWTSNRVGSPDLFFETLAPRLTPIPLGK